MSGQAWVVHAIRLSRLVRRKSDDTSSLGSRGQSTWTGRRGDGGMTMTDIYITGTHTNPYRTFREPMEYENDDNRPHLSHHTALEPY